MDFKLLLLILGVLMGVWAEDCPACIFAEKYKEYIFVNDSMLEKADRLARDISLSYDGLNQLLSEVVSLDDNTTIFNEVLAKPFEVWDNVKSTDRLEVMLQILNELFDVQPNVEAHYYGSSNPPNIPSCVSMEERLAADSPTQNCAFEGAYKYYQLQGKCLDPNNPGAGLAGREMHRIGEQFCFTDDQQADCKLPSARKISLELGELFKKRVQPGKDELIPNLVVLHWYQNVVHETEFQQFHGLLNNVVANSLKACGSNRRHLPSTLLFPYSKGIEVDCDDPFYGLYNVRCLNFLKSHNLNEKCELKRSNLYNAAPPTLDLSTVYETYSRDNKDFITAIGPDGKLFKDADGNIYVPFRNNKQNAFASSIAVMIGTMHDLLVDELLRIDPCLAPTKAGEVARRINTAFHQHIFYFHLLPLIMGTNNTVAGNTDDTYSTEVPQCVQEWATVAGRFFHAFLVDRFYISDLETFRPTASFKARDAFGDIHHFSFNRRDEFIAGMIYQHWKVDGFSPELQNNMFFDSKLKYGADLFALDTERNRDTCTEPYINYLKRFFGVCISSWDDLEQFLPKYAVEKLQKIYRRIEDVELYMAAELEHRFEDSQMGPTNTRITEIQFAKFKNGDPKFYTHSFNECELKEIVKMDVGRFTCIALHLQKNLLDARFGYLAGKNEVVDCECKSLRECFDLSVFLES